jgi:hypothetical protein
MKKLYNMKKINFLFLGLLLSTNLLFSQQPILVKDFYAGTDDAVPIWGLEYFQHKDLVYMDVLTADRKYDLFVLKNQSPILLKRKFRYQSLENKWNCRVNS